MVEYKIQDNHIELYFDEIPTEKIRDTLKICGWRWVKAKRCWSNYYCSDNVVWAKNMCEELNPKKESTLLKLVRMKFDATSLIIRTNGFSCGLNHNVVDLAGEISICNRQGIIETCLVPIAYCITCGTYYMLEETFYSLKKKGIILTQIMTKQEYKEYGEYDGDFGKWRDKSPLRIWGYSVSQEDGYSIEQRHAILEDIVDCGKMSKDRVMSYLDFFVRVNGHKGITAIEKWKSDREYIANYKIGSAKRVRIDKIIVIER